MSLYSDLTSVLTPYAEKIKDNASKIYSTIANNLITDSTRMSLSARQGKILNEIKIDKPVNVPADKYLKTDANGDAVWGDGFSQEAIDISVKGWLDDHVSGGQTLALDSSFTLENAAPVSKFTGERLDTLENKVRNVSTYELSLLASYPRYVYGETNYHNAQSIVTLDGANGIFGVISTSATATNGIVDGKIWVIDTINERFINAVVLEHAYHANGACIRNGELLIAPSYNTNIYRYTISQDSETGEYDFTEETPIAVSGMPTNVAVEAVMYNSDDDELYVMGRGVVYQLEESGNTATAVRLFECPSAFPELAVVDNIGTMGYNNGEFWVAGTGPNWLMRLDKTGYRIATYSTGSNKGEPEGMTFYGNKVYQLFNKTFTNWRFYDIYEIDTDAPYSSYDIFINPGSTSKYVQYENNTSLRRDGTAARPFRCLNEALQVVDEDDGEATQLLIVGHHPRAVIKKKNFVISGSGENPNIDTLVLTSCIGSIKNITINGLTNNHSINVEASVLRLDNVEIANPNLEGTGTYYDVSGSGALIVNSNVLPESLRINFNGSINGSNSGKVINTNRKNYNFYTGYRYENAFASSGIENTQKTFTLNEYQVCDWIELNFMVQRTPVQMVEKWQSSTYNRSFLYTDANYHGIYCIKIAVTINTSTRTVSWAYTAYNPITEEEISLPATLNLRSVFTFI